MHSFILWSVVIKSEPLKLHFADLKRVSSLDCNVLVLLIWLQR